MATRIYQVFGEVRKRIFTLSVNCLCGGMCGKIFIQDFEVTKDSGAVWELKSLDDSIHGCKKIGEKFRFTTALVQSNHVHYINCQIVGEKSL